MDTRNNKSANHGESSLLFQLPNSMLNFNEMGSSPLLMPVVAETSCDTKVSTTQENMKPDRPEPAFSSKPVCQLEQPLHFRKPSQNSPSVFPIPSQPQTTFSTASTNVLPETSKLPDLPLFQGRSTCPDNNFGNSPECFVSSHNAELPTDNVYLSSTVNAPINSEFYNDQSRGFYPHPVENIESSHCHNSSMSHTDCNHFSATGSSFPNDYQVYNQSDTDFNYIPVRPHWLFQDIVENKEIWYAFSEIDSEKLEAAFQEGVENVVPTDGGRYDVYLVARLKKSVYYEAKDLHVKRCTWFYETGSSLRCKPYDEDTANILEQHYYNCVTSGHWQRRFNIPSVGSFSFENAQVMLHFRSDLEVWPSLTDSKACPKVKRGLPDGFEIMPDESPKIDHLVFVVQGIGSFCDLRFRTVAQCVDGFRGISNKLIESHFVKEDGKSNVERVEFLPVAWHAQLHTSEIGLDRRMKNITLPSIPKLRHFTNDTLLDILLYSTPSYCQSIIDTVACELNKLYDLFLVRNPNFVGRVFVAGHSLGSLILFDILANQNASEVEVSSETDPSAQLKALNVEDGEMQDGLLDDFVDVESLLKSLELMEHIQTFDRNGINFDALLQMNEDDFKSLNLPIEVETKILDYICTYKQSKISSGALKYIPVEDTHESLSSENAAVASKECNIEFPSQAVNSGMTLIVYPRLSFKPAGFFALGSPISMFLAVRGYDTISKNFEFPTCPAFFHIFHPYDPVAFRIEPLIDPSFSAKPVMIPHYKGRKRMHLEIRENLAKIASDIKQKLMNTMRYTWNSLSELARNQSIMEAEVNKLVEEEISQSDQLQDECYENIHIGRLNGGRRIDFVLQEKPIEALNDYVFALTSHATYWNSEDTVLMILREIYATQGIVVSTQQMENKPLQPTILHDNAAYFQPLTTIDNNPDNCPKSFDDNPSYWAPPPTTNSNPTVDFHTITSSTIAPGTQHIGPPPLSGFIKQSPFSR